MAIITYFILPIYLIVLANGQTSVPPTVTTPMATTMASNPGQPQNDNDLAFVEKDLPDFNMFRTAGDWVLRAISDKNKYFTRANFKLDDNKVIFSKFMGRKLLSSAQHRHIKYSKLLQAEKIEDKELKTFVGLYQDGKVIVYVIVKQNGEKTLIVLVKNCENTVIDDESIRKLISHKLMAKPNVRQLIEPLVQNLEFVNRNLPNINYDIQDYPISESDLVDWDLLNSIGNWTLRGVASNMFAMITQMRCMGDGNKIIATTYNGDKQNSSTTWSYYGSSKVIRTDIYAETFHELATSGIPFIDANSFIVIWWFNSLKTFGIGVWMRSEASVDVQYYKKVIDNQLLFCHDINRVIKDLVPTIAWK